MLSSLERQRSAAYLTSYRLRSGECERNSAPSQCPETHAPSDFRELYDDEIIVVFIEQASVADCRNHHRRNGFFDSGEVASMFIKLLEITAFSPCVRIGQYIIIVHTGGDMLSETYWRQTVAEELHASDTSGGLRSEPRLICVIVCDNILMASVLVRASTAVGWPTGPACGHHSDGHYGSPPRSPVIKPPDGRCRFKACEKLQSV